MKAESVMMAKERLVERYGDAALHHRHRLLRRLDRPAHRRQRLPGIYQGLVTTCSYPDTFTAGAQFADYHLLRLYFEDPSRWAPGVAWLPTQMAQVEGHLSHVNAVVADEGLFKAALNPENDCSGTVDPVAGDPSHPLRLRDQPRRRPLLGARPAGQPARPAARVGVDRAGAGGRPRLRRRPVRQHRRPVYGLDALKAGAITPAQFVDLNVKVGGLDIDSEPTARADRRRPGRDRERLPHRPDQRGQQPRRGRDHQPRRPRPGHRPRLRPRVLDRGAAAAPTRATPTTG